MYAVIRTGGKQYRVQPGQQLRVDRLVGAAGDFIELNEVLMFSSEGSLDVGTPCLENARVVASIVEQGRGKKINVFKYKSKIRYRKLQGHRQHHTDLRIEELVGPDGTSYKHEKKERVVEVVVVEDALDEATDELAADDDAVDSDTDAVDSDTDAEEADGTEAAAGDDAKTDDDAETGGDEADGEETESEEEGS
jgi:large subunit ribosomal protein L21